jgi:hypothetical protein
MTMTILALDLGTTTGWALCGSDDNITICAANAALLPAMLGRVFPGGG